METLTKYIYGNARVLVVRLDEAVAHTAQLQSLSPDEAALAGQLEAFAACLAGLQKEEGASVSVKLTQPERRRSLTALAEKSGQVRACLDEIEAPAGESGELILEVVQRLPLRGNYTGVVCAPDFPRLIRSYFSRSLQIEAECLIFTHGPAVYCVLAEQLPGLTIDLAAVAEDTCALLNEDAPLPPEEFQWMETTPLCYGCTCTRSAVYRVINAMTPEERAEMAVDGKIVTHCKFCGKQYSFEI